MRRRSRLLWLALPLSVATLVAPNGGNAAARRISTDATDVLRPGFMGEDSLAPGDLDARVGKLRPTSAQVAHAKRLGANARWNMFGTPASLFNRTGYLSGPSTGNAVTVARNWVRDNAAIFRLTPAQAGSAHLELVANNPLYESPDNRRLMQGLKPLAKDSTLPHVVLFRQVFDGVDAGASGLLTVGLDPQNRVTYVSSSVSGDLEVTNTKKIGVAEAWRLAAANVGWHVPLADIVPVRAVNPHKFDGLKVPGQSATQLGRFVAVPTPRDGVRLAWEIDVIDNDRVSKKGEEPLAYMTHVDAQTGKILKRWNAVKYAGGGVHASTSTLPMQAPVPDPWWLVFPNTPTWPVQGVASLDTREKWCWVEAAATDCDRVVGGSAFPRNRNQLKFAWDELPAPDGLSSTPTTTSQGNDAWTTGSFVSHLTPDLPRYAVSKPLRGYDYAFTDQWHTSNCNLSANYATDDQNDLDAAINNLFVNYGRMHDWSYYLGFRETTWNMQQVNFNDEDAGEDGDGNDPEKGQAQAGAVAGAAFFTGRDNANQTTLQDGVVPITNQYLWHPLQGAFYSPCVDGAYDMTIVAHEYGHAISNRMIDGPDNGIGGTEGGKMGEGWSDLMAMEYVNGYGFAPVGAENPYSVGPYATGNPQSAIRNYGMNDSPLNYSQLLYDGNGQTGPHSDSEIWSAANFNVRKALLEKYESQFPSSASNYKTLQYQCADGLVDSKQCPGNRRWIQLMFDGFLLQEGAAGMPGAAESQLAADKMRYAGANQKEIWKAYAEMGIGTNAEEPGDADFTTPLENIEAQVRFQAVEVDGGGTPKELYIHPGPFSARTTEQALAKDGEPSPIELFVPGKYFFTARADGYGQYQFEKTFEAGKSYLIEVPMRKNLASEINGAEASGDGGNHSALIDDSEEFNWAFLGETSEEDIAGKQVTVDLTGGAHLVKEIQVSAMNRPAAPNDAYDDIAQNRFAALRSFEIWTCDATKGADCEEADSFQKIYTSDADAFPSGRPRPTSEDLRMRTFNVPDTQATHVQLRVLTNQCTGNPIYSGEQNPVGEEELADPDCVTGFTLAPLTAADPTADEPIEPNNTQKHRVRISELQVYSSVTPGTKETSTERPPAAGPAIPTTGGSPVLPIAGLALAALAALVLRRQRAA